MHRHLEGLRSDHLRTVLSALRIADRRREAPPHDRPLEAAREDPVAAARQRRWTHAARRRDHLRGGGHPEAAIAVDPWLDSRRAAPVWWTCPRRARRRSA